MTAPREPGEPLDLNDLAAVHAAHSAPASYHCIQCGYDLGGLVPEGVCPECGTPIERSMRGNLLAHASHDYVATLHTGLRWVLNGILVWVVWTLFGSALSMYLISAGRLAPATTPPATPGGAQGTIAAFPTASFTAADIVVTGVGFLINAAILWGWWQLSTPDPGYEGRDDGSRARVVVRWAVIAYLATQGISVVTGFVAYAASTSAGGVGAVLSAVSLGVMVLDLAAFAVWFFASMLYIRWLAPRAECYKAFKRAKVLMWAGPLLVTVGACACIGPLVALVLYWNMLHWLRLRIREIQTDQQFAPS